MKKRLKINGAIIVAVILIVAFFPAVFFRLDNNTWFDEGTEVFGVVFILLGQVLRTSARGHKAEHSRQGNMLIQGGPYELVRNPMYLGIFLIGLGIVLMLFNWWVVGIFLFVFIVRYLLLIFKEEKILLEKFPKDYPDYKNRVPRLFPLRLVSLQEDISEYLPLKFAWIKKEIGTMLAVLFIAVFVESWEGIRNEGIRIYLKEAMMVIIIIMLYIGLVIYLSKRTYAKEKNVSNKSNLLSASFSFLNNSSLFKLTPRYTLSLDVFLPLFTDFTL